MFAVLGWLIFSFLIGYLAANRGRNSAGWLVLALLISPLIAGIILIVIPDLTAEEEKGKLEVQRQHALAESEQIENQRLLIEQNTVNTDSFIERLEKYGRLHHHDMLTDEEFRDRKNAAISELAQKRLNKAPEDFLYDIIALKDTGVLDDSDMNRIKTIVL